MMKGALSRVLSLVDRRDGDDPRMLYEAFDKLCVVLKEDEVVRVLSAVEETIKKDHESWPLERLLVVLEAVCGLEQGEHFYTQSFLLLVARYVERMLMFFIYVAVDTALRTIPTSSIAFMGRSVYAMMASDFYTQMYQASDFMAVCRRMNDETGMFSFLRVFFSDVDTSSILRCIDIPSTVIGVSSISRENITAAVNLVHDRVGECVRKWKQYVEGGPIKVNVINVRKALLKDDGRLSYPSMLRRDANGYDGCVLRTIISYEIRAGTCFHRLSYIFDCVFTPYPLRQFLSDIPVWASAVAYTPRGVDLPALYREAVDAWACQEKTPESRTNLTPQKLYASMYFIEPEPGSRSLHRFSPGLFVAGSTRAWIQKNVIDCETNVRFTKSVWTGGLRDESTLLGNIMDTYKVVAMNLVIECLSYLALGVNVSGITFDLVNLGAHSSKLKSLSGDTKLPDCCLREGTSIQFQGCNNPFPTRTWEFKGDHVVFEKGGSFCVGYMGIMDNFEARVKGGRVQLYVKPHDTCQYPEAHLIALLV